MFPKRLFAVVICLLLVALAVTPALAAKEYQAENFDVLVEVQSDGTILVTETVTFHFEGGPFTYVFREIPRRGTDAIEVVTVTRDGLILEPGTEPGQAEIDNGDPLKVTWHFSPVSDATHEFGLTYRVAGVIQHSTSADTLTWPAIPADHEYRINGSLIGIQFPASVTPLTTPVLEGEAATLETGPGRASFTLSEIDLESGVRVTLTFPSGSLVQQPPAWQIAQEQSAAATNKAMPFGLGAAAFTTILGLSGVVWLSQALRRNETNETTTPTVTEPVTTPPSSTAPALAARLVKSNTPFLGTLFALGQRGLLHIEEGPKKWGGRTYEIVRQPVEAGLAPHEQAFMQALFRKSKHERVALTEIASLAYSQPYTQAMDEEIMRAGWFDARRIRQRSRFLALAWLGFGIGLAIFLAGLLLSSSSVEARTLGVTLVGSGIGLGLTGFIGAIMTIATSTLTPAGEQQAAAWNRFMDYLRHVSRGRETSTNPDLFERYLPYAAAFGMATEWGKYFQKMEHITIPEWFQSLHSSLDDGSLVAVMGVITAINSSTTAGATGASSGGSSGAG